MLYYIIRSKIDTMKFFCIGCFRSGTSSTRKYLESLGLSAVNWGTISKNYENYPHNMGLIEASLEVFDVFGDIPYNYPEFIEKMMGRYPDALFFLSTRDESDWLESVKRHRDTRIEGVSNLITKETLRCVGVIGESDEDLKASYVERNRKVVKMFENANQGHRLCTFSLDDSSMKKTIDKFIVGSGLELNRGNESFPWEERTK